MPVAPGLLFHAKPSSSQALSFGAELHVRFAFSYSLNIERASLYGQLDLPSLVIAVIAAVLYRFLFFFCLFPSWPFQQHVDVSSTALAALVSPAHLLSPMPVSSPVASNQLLLCKPFSLQCQHTGSTQGTEQPVLSVQLAFNPKDPSFSYILGLSSLQSHP